MKTLTRLPQIFACILLVLVLSEFVFVAYNWLSYCSPVAAARFAFSGTWLKEEFQHVNAGFALDQPTIGKFFLWTSLMSYLACTIMMLVHIVVDVDRRVTRRWVSLCAALLVAIVLIEFLAPTFLLVQYVVSLGITIRRFLGLCLCGGFWIFLPAVVFWIRKTDLTLTSWARSPITWTLVSSLVVPTYYLILILPSFPWCGWTIMDTAFILAWLILVAPIPCIIWLTALGKIHSVNQKFGLVMKRIVLSLLIALAVVAAVVASCAGPIWWTEASERRFLLKHVDHRAVGTACLDLLTKREYQTLMGQYPSGADSRLPPAIRKVKAFWLSVQTNQVLIMMPGRHCHMAFIFRPNDSDSNLYDLVFREERDLEHGIRLYSVRKE